MSSEIPHIILIQACYTDHELSRRRLTIARTTSFVSLAIQSRKPIIRIIQHPDDPHAAERLEMYQSTGCEVVSMWRDGWRVIGENWELPAGRKVVSRIDDDDIICRDYCERTYAMAPKTGDHVLTWPNGYVLWRERAYALRHPGTQFISVVTDGDHDPHEDQHYRFPKTWHNVIVSREVGWIWVRHGDAATSTLKKYRAKLLNRIDTTRIPMNLRAVIRAVAASGLASGDYREHRAPNRETKPEAQSKNLLAVSHYNRNSDETIYGDLVLTLNSIRLHSSSELIVVDDGSPVKYQQNVQRLCDSMGVTLIKHSTNQGVSAAKNTCLNYLKRCDWDFCFLLDDDIEILSPRFESEYVAAMRNSEVGILSFNDPGYTKTDPIAIGELNGTSHTCGVCVVVSRECFAMVGKYRILPELWGWEHIEYYSRAAEAGFAKRGVYCDIQGSEKLIRIASEATVFSRDERVRMSEVNLAATREPFKAELPEGCFYEGRFCQQVSGFDQAMKAFFTENGFTDIVEIGTGHGGFVTFLRKTLPEAKITTFDIEKRFEGTLSGIEFRQESGNDRSVLAQLIAEAGKKLLVICDGGDRPAEVGLVASLLRQGDTVMCHDYCESEAIFERDYRDKIWDWCEITDANIPESLKKVDARLNRVMWGVFACHELLIPPCRVECSSDGVLELNV